MFGYCVLYTLRYVRLGRLIVQNQKFVLFRWSAEVKEKRRYFGAHDHIAHLIHHGLYLLINLILYTNGTYCSSLCSRFPSKSAWPPKSPLSFKPWNTWPGLVLLQRKTARLHERFSYGILSPATTLLILIIAKNNRQMFPATSGYLLR